MKTFQITFTQAQLGILSDAIGEIPTKLGVPLLNAINGQLAAQERAEMQAAAERAAAERAAAAAAEPATPERAPQDPIKAVLLNGAAHPQAAAPAA